MTDTPSDPSEPPSSSSADEGPQRSGACEIELQIEDGFGAGETAGTCHDDVDPHSLESWLAPLLAELAPGAGSVTVRFVDDDEMRRLNASWRGKDRTTDVLSFPGDVRHPDVCHVDMWHADAVPAESAWGVDPSLFDGEPLHLGDLVISVPVARRQAAAAGHTVGRELRLLVLHGVLHCLGFDHEVDDGAMERVEATLRARWLGPSPVPAELAS